MQKMLEQVHRELGFIGVVCLAGPEPKEGGKLNVILYVSRFLFPHHG